MLQIVIVCEVRHFLTAATRILGLPSCLIGVVYGLGFRV